MLKFPGMPPEVRYTPNNNSLLDWNTVGGDGVILIA